ncbi:Predicted arabinose efflux permease, MFS family [Persephonella hydrogeniphila]|uniref:Predicted arabinose efflux permease, MFS family n=1 Tax=Persephonella hydrogeniphila TaxID=198703 RepID=A0A285NME9_9AQUI|nr:MFS transporter [Persephonella hydrogeniphila]SNZ09036.1 Predicted arabinose efflux permease, MFS family [Persephonella hydrogeniphila]
MIKINKNIIFLGIVSFLTDLSSEMIFPILPIFLDHFLKASKFEIGIIEGAAEFTASFLKVWSGYLSDRIGKKKSVVVAGYTISAFTKPLLYFAGSWKDVLFLRVLERTGKGIRTSPRDALISAYTQKERSGRAFGFHRGMDTLGAVFGAVLASVFIFSLGETEETFRFIFLFSFLPAILAVFVLLFFVKEPKVLRKKRLSKFSLRGFSTEFYKLLILQVIFTVFTMNYAFMILKANSIGIAIGFIPIVYILFNVVYAFSSYPVGYFSDRFGKAVSLSITYLIFSITAFLFTVDKPFFGWIAFVFYGVFMAGNEVISRAIISDVVDEKIKGTAYGIYHTAIGISTFISTAVAGFLWDRFGEDIPFIIGGIGALILSVICYTKLKGKI